MVKLSITLQECKGQTHNEPVVEKLGEHVFVLYTLTTLGLLNYTFLLHSHTIHPDCVKSMLRHNKCTV